jgi:hypothetical protein
LVPEGKALRRSLLAVAAKQNDAGPFSSRGIENEKRASALVSAQWRGRAEGVGFEPTRRSSRLPLFESGTLNHSDTPPHARCRAEALHTYWYARRDSNPRPLGPQPNALSTELRAHDPFSGAGVRSTGTKQYSMRDCLVARGWRERASLREPATRRGGDDPGSGTGEFARVAAARERRKETGSLQPGHTVIRNAYRRDRVR